ncbi:MAG: amidohydrolase family protein, partial [Pseudomonadota bacterium]
MTDTILMNAQVTTFDPERPEASAVAIADGRIEAIGSDADILALKGEGTTVIDLSGRRAIPGLIDSHTHIIRKGNNFAMELRWDRAPSLADGLRMLKAQAERTPSGQWIRVVGGWCADQFAERRL